LKGAEAALRARLGIPLSPLDRAESEESMTKARAMLGGEAFACSWEGGQAMSLQEAITYALE
jgi:hypothetical protein